MEDFFLRRNILNTFLWIVGIIFIFQLFKLQIILNPLYNKKSDDNSIKKIEIEAPRGVFFDRNFNVLVSNKPSYIVEITASEFNKTNLKEAGLFLGTSSPIEKALNVKNEYLRYLPNPVAEDVKYNFIAWFEENRDKLPGISYRIKLKRDYSFGIYGSHIFGYVREISGKMLKNKKENFRAGDFIGYSGLEKYYEDLIRGEKGYNLMLVDSKLKVTGKYLNGEKDKEPIKGNDLILTIDKKLQLKAEELLKDKRGAIVAIEPKTGGILAFVSSPYFDLSAFAAVTSQSNWLELINHPEKPLFNRASQAMYPPGSTFKMAETIAALEEGIIDTTHKIVCNGGYFYGDRFFECTGVHGTTNILKSIEKSCNTFYYDLALRIGLNKWEKYTRLFGFGKKTEVDIFEETAGLVPGTDYYNKVYGKNGWTTGFLVSLGIGQGEFGASPLQMAQYAAILANHGKTIKPHFVKGFIDSKTNEFVELEFDSVKINVSEKNLEIARRGMLRVVEGEGTAWRSRVPNVKMAGKTGTSQNPHGENHALFIGFAPYDDPEIAFAIVVENSGYGSVFAAPLAKELVSEYFNVKISQDNFGKL